MDFLLDGLDAGERVALQSGETVGSEEVLPDIELGIEGIGRDEFHHGREGFVQPEVVPPSHSDEVAEPLVGEFVGDGDGDGLLRFKRSAFVGEEARFAVSDETPVLHSASFKIRESNLVELRERILYAELLVVKIESLRRSVVRKNERGLRLVQGGIGDNLDAVLVRRLDGVEGPTTQARR